MNKKETLLTKEGYEKLKKEYDTLVNIKRPVVIDTIQKTRAMGDLSENGGYQAAKEEQRFVDRRIGELEGMLKTAKIIEDRKNNDKVSLGSTVYLDSLNDDFKVSYELVGSAEADPSKKRISYESPLGKSLLGAKKGDIVVVSTPVGDTKYKILKIE
ncbi:transcription elongation factor GreA [candidate division WWE3 bacterium CG10_big_fil_rev_8_21_14_0_10_32_10]|uniref:Transcription elongation factor GreA n=1 Tax=candidate division WWE3 bacterium CG10_big_fil_rev_8_21_14_0_10_32_10 TaxID=1975090 RepID=A0A2H0R9C9_UNCKA|nr:MAG: transcription elongation factor GreA [candidate division WWE3 bacterium CG10_big_fil_rev_8_21_14_0_10_32_10]